MTRREMRNLGGAIACLVFAFSSAIVAVGCSDTDAATRAQTLASPSARRLIGVWRVSFWLDRGAAITRNAADTSPIVGTVAFTEDSHGVVSADELTGPTHDGVYDIDFSRFGFRTRGSGEFPGAIARVTEGRRGKTYQHMRDSLSIILSPGTQLYAVWMTGEMGDDTVAGVWTAAANRSDGGSGHFVMRRQAQ